MVDLIVALMIFAGLWTGYRRGVARELIELVAMLVAIPLAFRVGPGPIQAVADLPDANASLMAGVLALMIITALAALLARAGERSGVLIAPNGPERTAGALVGGLRSLTLLWVIFVVLAGAPVLSLSSLTTSSQVASALSGESSLDVFTSVTGQDDLITLVEFNRRFPDGPLVGDETSELPAFPTHRLTSEPGLAADMAAMVNADRDTAGQAAVQWSATLAAVAEAYAFEMYQDGFFAHDSARSGNVADRVAAAGIGYRVVGENLALAPALDGAHAGLMESPEHRANILGPYARVGIGVVRGPIGLVIVQVFHR